MFFVSCVYHALASVHCSLVVTCWERADLLALVGDVYCISGTFPCSILGQVWYLIVLFPNLCHLSYFLQNCLKLYNCLRKLVFFYFISTNQLHFKVHNCQKNSSK